MFQNVGQRITPEALSEDCRMSQVFLLSLTCLLTPWTTFLPEKLTGSQPVKKFPTFYGTRRFITAFTRVRNLPLS
jgi:hypothetical protein